jgi:hypothetical protein
MNTNTEESQESHECIICLEPCNIQMPWWWSFYYFIRLNNNVTRLCEVYNCKCNILTHINCLQNVSRCPTCRTNIREYIFDSDLNYVNGNKYLKIKLFILKIHISFYLCCIVPIERKNKNLKNKINLLISVLQAHISQYSLLLYYSISVYILYFAIEKRLKCSSRISKCMNHYNNNTYNSDAYEFCKKNIEIMGCYSDDKAVVYVILANIFVFISFAFVISIIFLTHTIQYLCINILLNVYYIFANNIKFLF